MAVNNLNPGIGPTNADIAAAVAAPSASTIASAVAAPSASTIATAVAAAVPTLTQINTAVNTQTNNSAIATAVAGAVPTISAINTAVANNASPYGGTWANLAAVSNPGSSTTLTVSGLSGYKYLQLIFLAFGTTSGGEAIRMRFNGNSSNIYFGVFNSTTTNTVTFADNGFYITPSNMAGPRYSGHMEIRGSNSSTSKMFFSTAGVAPSSGGGAAGFATGVWENNAAIDSITFYTHGGSILDSGRVVVRGAN